MGALAAGALALREQEPTNPAAYLALRGLRWGELRAGGSDIDELLLEAPPRETRVSLKRLTPRGELDRGSSHRRASDGAALRARLARHPALHRAGM